LETFNDFIFPFRKIWPPGTGRAKGLDLSSGVWFCILFFVRRDNHGRYILYKEIVRLLTKAGIKPNKPMGKEKKE